MIRTGKLLLSSLVFLALSTSACTFFSLDSGVVADSSSESTSQAGDTSGGDTNPLYYRDGYLNLTRIQDAGFRVVTQEFALNHTATEQSRDALYTALVYNYRAFQNGSEVNYNRSTDRGLKAGLNQNIEITNTSDFTAISGPRLSALVEYADPSAQLAFYHDEANDIIYLVSTDPSYAGSGYGFNHNGDAVYYVQMKTDATTQIFDNSNGGAFAEAYSITYINKH